MSRGRTAPHERRVPLAPVGAVLALVLAASACTTSAPPEGDRAGTTPATGVTSTPAAPGAPVPSVPAPGPAPAPTPSAPDPLPPAAPPEPAEPAVPAPAEPPAPAAAGVPTAWRGIDLERLATDRPVVALTFDAGASDTAVGPILATLARHQAPATFFVTGSFARSFPEAVRAMASAGHPVGNHSDTHPDFTVTTSAAIRAELAAAEADISRLTGTTTRPLFRFPFGARTSLDIEVVNDEGYVPVRWTVDTLGWRGTSGGIDQATVHRRVMDTLQPGSIVLMHVGAHPSDGTTLDADALGDVIESVRAAGYTLVDLSDLLG